MMSMDRRNALKNIIGITTVAAGATLVPSFANAADETWVPTPADFNNLQYVKLDPMEVAKIAYAGDVKDKGCMYQVFHALVTALANVEGPDQAKWAAIPTALSVYGSGGIFGQGTVCGNNNAAGMFYKWVKISTDSEGKKVGPKTLSMVSAFYEQTPLPFNDEAFLTAMGETAATFEEKVGVQTEAHSLLCHASLTRWSDAAGIPITAKGPRCTLLSASMAYQIAVILNAELEGADLSGFPGETEETSACLGCHTKGESPMGAASVMSHMECDTCHGTL